MLVRVYYAYTFVIVYVYVFASDITEIIFIIM